MTLVLHFDAERAAEPAEDFVAEVLVGYLHAGPWWSVTTFTSAITAKVTSPSSSAWGRGSALTSPVYVSTGPTPPRRQSEGCGGSGAAASSQEREERRSPSRPPVSAA